MADALAVTSADLLRRLRRLATKRGWDLDIISGKGSHLRVSLNDRTTSIPSHRGDIAIGTFRGILKQLALTEKDLET